MPAALDLRSAHTLYMAALRTLFEQDGASEDAEQSLFPTMVSSVLPQQLKDRYISTVRKIRACLGDELAGVPPCHVVGL